MLGDGRTNVFRTLILAPLATALLCGQANPIAEANPPAKSEVVVTGERLTSERRRERDVAYVRHPGIAAGEQPTARWLDRLCLKVVGLTPDSAREVAARVRTIAIEAGVPMAGGACKPNAVIAFAADGGAVVREVAAKRSGSLQEVTPAARKALLTGDAPIRWWYSTQTRGKDGMGSEGGQPASITGEAASVGPGTSSAASAGQTLPGNMDTQFQTVRGASFISTESLRSIYAANVVVDVTRLKSLGVGLDAVTDYATFVTLAEIRPRSALLEGAVPSDSILGMFTNAAAERHLTLWDAALLRELYRMPLDRIARMQRGALTAAVIDAGKRP